MAVDKVRQRVSPSQPLAPIPDKLYFKIGEVAELVGVPAHVLRYWEREVSAIRPGKSASRQRRYRRKDVEIFREIRRLLYKERYTLAGARRRLLSNEPEDVTPETLATEGSEDVVQELILTSSEVLAPVPAEPVQALDTEPAPLLRPSRAPQLDLGFPVVSEQERKDRLRSGLRELIRLAGEEP